MYTRSDKQIHAAVVEGVMRSLSIDPTNIDIEVRAGIVTLSGHMDRHSIAEILVAFVKATLGVVDVVDRLSWTFDDRDNAAAEEYQRIPVRH